MSVRTLTATILDKMSNIGKWQSEFLLHNFELQCQMRGRHNFSGLSRYGRYHESTYRENYSRPFDFEAFNLNLIDLACERERIVVFDPSHISKSGKHTPGCGYFWSGCAGHTKWGLEIGGFAAVDIINNTALHLIADQTIGFEEYGNLLNYYAALVCRRAETIKKVSPYLAVDAFFSKKPFIDPVLETGLHVITRLRDDADLLYPYVGPHPKRRGAQQKYAGKFDPRNLDEAYFSCCIEEKDFRLYEATLYSRALKRYIRVAVKHTYDEQGKIKSHKIYASTDTTMSGIDIYCYYTARYQIEFLYRDAKQHTGLEHGQSRSQTKLHFHFNTALTTVSLAKASHHLNIPLESRPAFSMADIKTQYLNELMLETFFEAFGIEPNEQIIIPIKRRLLKMGKIRA